MSALTLPITEIKIKEEVKSLVTKAATISGFLRDILWRNKHLSIKDKTRIYIKCVYAGEMRAETAAAKRLLWTAEMIILQAITGYTLHEHK